MNRLLIAGLMCFVSFGAIAQSLDIVESKKISISVGTKGFSMLDVLNRSVQHVDVDSTACLLDSQRSKNVGKVVFKPLGDKPFTMFISDNHGDTYAINVMVNKSKSPDLYTIKNVQAEQRLEQAKSAAQKYQVSSVKAISLGQGRNKAILDLIKAMSSGDSPRNVDVYEVSNSIPLWIEAELIEKKRYSIGKLVGQMYQLKNVSNSSMILNEAEFYPMSSNTLAVAIEKHELAPSQSTFVYVVTAK